MMFSCFVCSNSNCVCVSADQVYGDQDMHEVVRKHCMDYLVSHSDLALT